MVGLVLRSDIQLYIMHNNSKYSFSVNLHLDQSGAFFFLFFVKNVNLLMSLPLNRYITFLKGIWKVTNFFVFVKIKEESLFDQPLRYPGACLLVGMMV